MKKITLAKAKSNIEDADRMGQANWREEAYESQKMYNGYQWPDSDSERMRKEGRPNVTFNRIAPLVDAMIGLELANRKEIKYYPRRIANTMESDIMNSISTWIRQESGQEIAEVDAERDMFITGIGCTDTRMSYEDSELGDLNEERVSPMDVRWDMHARKRNLLDAKWVARYKRMDMDEIAETWPDAKLDGLVDGDISEERKEVGRSPQTYNKTKESAKLDDRPKVWQYQYYCLEPYWKVENPFLKGDPEFFQFILADLLPVFGEQIQQKQLTLTEDGYKKLKLMAKDLGIKDYAASRFNKKVYYRLIFVGNVELHHDLNPVQGHFTQKFITGKRDETDGCWYGVIRSVKDPQLWANKFLSTLLYIYMHNSKGGVFVESDAVPNPEEFRKNYSKPGTAIIVNPGAIANGKIKDRSPAPLDSAAAQIMQIAVDAIPATSGINPAIIAMSSQNRSNALEETRIKQSATLLMDYFESMTQYRKSKGPMYVQFTKDYLCQEERLIRISDDSSGAPKFMQLMQDALADDYDVIAEEGALTINQKAETWTILGQLFQGQGIPIPLWKYAPIPASIANEIMQYLDQQQQGQQQMQQQQVQGEQMEMQAKAQKDTALAEKARVGSQQMIHEMQTILPTTQDNFNG